MREIQRHGITGRITHADFNEIDMTQEINVLIKIELTGEPEGVRNQNGVLEQVLREVEVTCLPGDVIESFVVEVSHLKLGDDITIGDLKLNPGMTLVSDPVDVVASITEAMEEIVEPEEGDEEDTPEQPEISVQKGKADEDAAPAAGTKK